MLQIETSRMRLVPVRFHHLRDLHRLHCDPNIVHTILDGVYPTIDQTRRKLSQYVRQWNCDGFGFWMVYENTNDRSIPLGRCGLRLLDGTDELELGYCYSGRASGKGVAVEAGRKALEFGFGQLAVERIVCVIRNGNIRSVRVAEKLGFRYVDHRWQYGKLMAYFENEANRPSTNRDETSRDSFNRVGGL